jgi:hypothetical protein
MVIFALSAVVLFVIMGLAVDAGLSYLHSDQQVKTAAAAALSGVGYLPGNFSDAQAEALLTSQRDGYTPGGSGSNATTVAVTQPAGTNNELQVTITAPAPVYFMELLGFGTHEVSATAIAEYLPPIQLGQPGSQLGSTLSGGSDVLGSTGYYFLRTEGWGNPRHEGDPFTPTPNDGEASCGPNINGNTYTPASSNPAWCQATTADVHQISCIDGNDLCNQDANGSASTECGDGANQLCVNDTGGSNYLIWVPAGTTASVSVYNPSFDPGDDYDCSNTVYDNQCIDTLHEDDGNFPELTSVNPSESSVPYYDYDTMAYTLFAVPDQNNRLDDIPLVQDLFCPFNAYDLDTGVTEYTYYADEATGSACNPAGTINNPANPTLVSGTVPTVYNAPPAGKASNGNSYTPVASGSATGWIPLNTYAPTGTNATLFDQPYNQLGASSSAPYVSGDDLAGGSSGEWFRLRVDTLQWNGQVVDPSCSSYPESDSGCPAVNSGSTPDNYALGHNGYSVEVTADSGSCASCSISAMGDMTIYTPINAANGGAADFPIPLFSLPQEYAGKVITVNVFNPGVTNTINSDPDAAYLGVLQPTGNPTTPFQYATLANGPNSVSYLGTNLGGTPPMCADGVAVPASGICSVASAVGSGGPNYAYSTTGCGTSTTAPCADASIQTGTPDEDSFGKTYSGDAIYRGSWLQFQIQVPSNYDPATAAASYWDLYYQVDSGSYAGNTVTVEVQYAGSPIHLLQG